MNIKKSFKKTFFEILSIVLIICMIDQLYMLWEYENINVETVILTSILTGLSVYFGFFEKNSSKKSVN